MKNRIALIVNILLLCLSLGAQSNACIYPDVDILLSPAPAYLCPSQDLVIESEYDFISYKWLDSNDHEIGNEKSVLITEVGDYKLIVENQTNTTLCEYEHEFEVLDYDDFSDMPYQTLTLYDIFVPSDFETLTGEEVATTRDPVCDTECDDVTYSTAGTEICYLEYTELIYHPDFCVSDPNPLYGFLYNLIQNSNSTPSNGFLITTMLSDLDECCDLRSKIKTDYKDNSAGFQVGLWIIVTPEPDPTQNLVRYKAEIKYRNDLNIPELPLTYDFGVQSTVQPTASNLIHDSQLVYNGEKVGPGYNDDVQTGNGVNDFAYMSDSHRDLISDAVQNAKNVWDVDVEFNISGYCRYIEGPDGIVIPSEEAAKKAYDYSGSDIVYWIHFNPDGTATFDVKSQNTTVSNTFASHPDYSSGFINDVNAAITSNLVEAAFQVESDFNNLSDDNGVGDGTIDGPSLYEIGLRSENQNKELGFFDYTSEIGGLMSNVVRTATIGEQLWRAEGENGKKSLFKFLPAGAGIGDGILEENPIGSAIQILGLGKDICTKPEVRSALKEMAIHPCETAKHMFSTMWENFSGNNGKEDQHYEISKVVVTTASTILSGGGIITTLNNAADNVSGALGSVREFVEGY